MARHTLIKLTKTKHKEKILKAAREKQQVTYKGNPIGLTAYFSAGQKGMAGYIYSTEREKYATKITVPSKELIQNWRNKKLFRQAKVKRTQYHQTSFTTNVKWPYIVKKYEKKKDLQNQPQTIKKMAIGTYISIIKIRLKIY